jgi:hypothetical protein
MAAPARRRKTRSAPPAEIQRHLPEFGTTPGERKAKDTM